VEAMRNEVSDLKQTIDFLSKKYDEHLVQINELKDENKNLKQQVQWQEGRKDDIDQYNRRQNILFDAIAEKKDEVTSDLVIEQCKKVGMTLTSGDIQVSHRLGKLKGDKPRPIIARFVSVGTARTIMLGVKQQFKKAATKPNNIQGTTKQPNKPPVRAREHLTDKRAKLVQKCLQLRTESKIHAFWVYNFDVYFKKLETDEQGYRIQHLGELNNL
jgi:hypothetical protein